MHLHDALAIADDALPHLRTAERYAPVSHILPEREAGRKPPRRAHVP